MVLVDENPYYYGAIGGMLLGIATTLNYVLRGIVTCMSGIIHSVLTLLKYSVLMIQRIFTRKWELPVLVMGGELEDFVLGQL